VKLKVLKRSSLLYNLPIFYIPKKARQKDPELFKATESWIFPIQQIRRSPSFLGHQRGQFNDSFWQLKGLVVITRWTITTTDGFYNTNTISLGNLADGTAWLPIELSEVHGVSYTEHLKCNCLHRWPPVTYWHTWETFKSLRTFFSTVTEEIFEQNLDKCLFSNKEFSCPALNIIHEGIKP